MKKTLALSEICGICFTLRRRLEKENIEVDTKYRDDHTKWFDKHDIRSVPRLVVEDGDKVEIIQGMDEIVEAITGKEK